MFTPTNPHQEQIRAQAMLSSFTEHKKAADLFAPMSLQDGTAELAVQAPRNQGKSILQIFKALKLNRRPVVVEAVQDTVYSS